MEELRITVSIVSREEDAPRVPDWLEFVRDFQGEFPGFQVEWLPSLKAFSRNPRRQYVVTGPICGEHLLLAAYTLHPAPDGYQLQKIEVRAFDDDSQLLTLTFEPALPRGESPTPDEWRAAVGLQPMRQFDATHFDGPMFVGIDPGAAFHPRAF